MTDEIKRVNAAIESGEYVPLREVARALDVTTEYMRRLARDGADGAHQIGRQWYYTREAVERMKEARQS